MPLIKMERPHFKKPLEPDRTLLEHWFLAGCYRSCTWLLQMGPATGLSDSKCFKKLCVNQVLYGCQAGSKKNFKAFYLGFMRDLKLFHVYDHKRVLSRSYPALRRVLYVRNRVLYGTKHCYARLDIPDRTTVDTFRRLELTVKFFNLQV